MPRCAHAGQQVSPPEDEFYASAQVPLEEQVEVQSEPVPPPADWRSDPMPWLDGGSGDVDGD